MEKEMESLRVNDVWDLVELPKDRKTVGSKWLFKVKIGADGSVERHKARLVAQVFPRNTGWTTMKPFLQSFVLNHSEQLLLWRYKMIFVFTKWIKQRHF